MPIHPALKTRYLFILLAMAHPAVAAETTHLGQVEVTASKMTETLKDVPSSIMVIDGTELEEQGITDIHGVVARIPNLNLVDFSSRNHINVRGINTSTFTLNNPVVLYIDGIPHSNHYAYDLPLMNVERIEVLRGPQGSLYGRDAIGGVINVVTKTPGNTWEGQVGLGLGDDKKREGSFSFEGPLSQGALYLGLYGRYEEDNGWISNTHVSQPSSQPSSLNGPLSSHPRPSQGRGNEETRKRLGANLLWTPRDDFRARLNLLREQHDQGFHNGGMIGSTAFKDARRSDFETVQAEMDTFNHSLTYSQGLNLEYDSAFGTFSSVTTHRRNDTEAQNDLDYGNSPVFLNQTGWEDVTLASVSQEFRWSHELESGARWVAGLYYEKDNTDFDHFGMMAFNWVSETDAQTQAVFGQVTVPLLQDVELTLGSRYQKIDKDMTLDSYAFGALNGELDVSDSWTAFLPKAALSYRINDDWMAYTSVADGYMPGGFNFLPFSFGAKENTFDPQKSTSYELGVKGDMLGGDLFLSASVFYMDIKDIHVFTNNNGLISTSNAGEGRSKGLELEFDYRIKDRWRLNGAFGLTQAEYASYTDMSGNVYDGKTIENTPSHSLNLSLKYGHEQGFYAITSLNKSGRVYFDAPNTLEEDGYVKLDLRAGYRLNDWELYAYVDNATDADYKTYGTVHTAGTVAYFGDPRMVGLGARLTF